MKSKKNFFLFLENGFGRKIFKIFPYFKKTIHQFEIFHISRKYFLVKKLI